ncbi:MAG: trypsin-like peptidase domain-containing protein [Spirochaetia bacterium]|nr:trypsin-like peptidase domain-containing protein [Spirochaetia bacterium]
MKKLILCIVISLIVFTNKAFTDSKSALFELQNQITSIADKIMPSVVHIKVVAQRKHKKYEAFGSGFFIDEKGHIFTNHHVVDDAISIKVKIYDDPVEYEAENLGSDETTDVAFLRIKNYKPISKKIKPLKLGDSKKTKVGQWVLAIGNPYGFDHTISFGIISAKGRNLPNAPVINEFIQTDAMIAPGSSGGPLLDLNGSVIGINSRANGRGIGFTIPIEVALDVKRKIEKEGKMKRAWLGMTFEQIEPEVRENLRISKDSGALVSYISQNSDAQKKIEPLDIILSIDGKKISAVEGKDIPGIEMEISKFTIGKKVIVEVLKKDKKEKSFIKNYSILVIEKPPVQGELYQSKLGFIARNITEHVYSHYLLQKRYGVYVEHIESGSLAGQAKLSTGDTILSVNGIEIRSVSKLKKLFETSSKEKEFLFVILRGRQKLYILLKNKKDAN